MSARTPIRRVKGLTLGVAAFLFLGAHAASAQVNYRITPITIYGPESAGQCIPTTSWGPPINNQGEVAFTAQCRGAAGVVVLADGRILRIVHSVPQPTCDGCIQGVAGELSINDAGVVAFKAVASRDGRLRDRILTASASGVATVLTAETAGFDSLNWPQISNTGTISFGAGLDANGTRYGVFRIADSVLRVVADDTTPTPRGFTRPGPMSAINSSDQIAFWVSATGPGNGAVFRADTDGTMTTVWPTLTGSAFMSMNDRGVLGLIDGFGRVTTSDGLSTQVIADLTQSDFFTRFRTVSINNDGAIAFHADVRNPLYFVPTGIFTGPDPIRDKVIQVGDTLDDYRVFDIRVSEYDSINDLGQIAFAAAAHRASDNQTILGLYRADPAGSTSENPLLPINPPTRRPAPGAPPPVWRFPITIPDFRARLPTWIDPDAAVGYRYAMSGAGASNFSGVIVPEPLPNGDDTFEVVFGNQSAVLKAGVLFDLSAATGGAGVREFTIRGIDTTEALDPHNPVAFVTGLTFVSAFSGEVTMTPLLATPSDATGPVVTGMLTPAPNGEGWNNTNVAIAWSASDPESAITSGPTPASGMASVDGAGQIFRSTATNGAGLVSDGSVTVNLDKTKPALIAGISAGTKGSNGWFTSNVTVRFVCSDATSGVASCPSDQALTGQGVNTSSAQTATDVAGNASDASNTVSVNIDSVSPTLSITGVQDGGVYTLGQGNPGIQCGDATSGVESSSGNLTGGNANGVGTFTYTAVCTDKAGNLSRNSATFRVLYVFGGFLQPIPLPGSTFKGGSTIPVKFNVTNGAGVNMTTAVATVSVNGGPSLGTATYDGEHYHFNVRTKGLPLGPLTIGVRLDDGTVRSVSVTLK